VAGGSADLLVDWRRLECRLLEQNTDRGWRKLRFGVGLAVFAKIDRWDSALNRATVKEPQDAGY
jgi:hypothetical protein